MKAYFGSNGEGKFVIETPDWLKEDVIEEFGQYYDPCPVDPVECGHAADWSARVADMEKDCVYVNPPYTRGSIAQWVQKCGEEHAKGCGPIVLLIPSYTDTAYFHDWIYEKPGVDVRFFKGRIQFKGYKTARASFPSMLVIFGADSERSLDASPRPFSNSLVAPDLLSAFSHPSQMSLKDFLRGN